MCKRKILFITPFVPSSEGAAENFTRLFLEELSANDFDVDLVYFKYSFEKEYIPIHTNIHVIFVKKNSIFVKLKNYLLYPFIHPIFSVRFDWKLMYNLRKRIKKGLYDYVYLDHSQMFLYGHFFPNIPIFMRSHDVMLQRYSRQGNLLLRWIIKKSEQKALNIKKAIIFVPSDKDKILLQQNYGIIAKLSKEYLDIKVINATPNTIEKRIIFLGKWTRKDNYDGLVWFIDNVYNSIDHSISIDIIGKGLPSFILEKIKEKKNICYHGFVDNPYPLIASSLCVVSPLFSGAGIKVKVIEALACGTPVVGNDISFEGIESPDFQFTKKANSPYDYIYEISNCYNLSVSDRINFKKKFIANYNNNSIIRFLMIKK